MRRSPRLPIARVSLAVAVLLGFAPLLAHAEERGPDELGHFIGVLSVFSFFFLSGVSFVVWLLWARLRAPAVPAKAALPYADLETLWFPNKR